MQSARGRVLELLDEAGAVLAEAAARVGVWGTPCVRVPHLLRRCRPPQRPAAAGGQAQPRLPQPIPVLTPAAPTGDAGGLVGAGCEAGWHAVQGIKEQSPYEPHKCIPVTKAPTAAPTQAPRAAPKTATTQPPAAEERERATAEEAAAAEEARLADEARVAEAKEKAEAKKAAAATPAPTAATTALKDPNDPTYVPTPTADTTQAPTSAPTEVPTGYPTASPTANPTDTPTAAPTATPTAAPTGTPTEAPTAAPTASPTANCRAS